MSEKETQKTGQGKRIPIMQNKQSPDIHVANKQQTDHLTRISISPCLRSLLPMLLVPMLLRFLLLPMLHYCSCCHSRYQCKRVLAVSAADAADAADAAGAAAADAATVPAAADVADAATVPAAADVADAAVPTAAAVAAATAATGGGADATVLQLDITRCLGK